MEGRSPPLMGEAQQPEECPQGTPEWVLLGWDGAPSSQRHSEEGTESAQHSLPRKNECFGSRMATASVPRTYLYLHPTRTLGEPLAPRQLEGLPIWGDTMHVRA